MPDVNVEFFLGGTSGIDEVALSDGQIFFNTEEHKILLDSYVDDELTRISMSESDLPEVMTGADASEDGTSGLVPTPMAGDQNKFLKGDATWGELDATNIEFDNTESGLDADDMQGAIDEVNTNLETHIADTNNPHAVTASQVGLGNVNNTADLDKPISTATQTALDTKVDKVEGKGLSTEDFTTVEKEKLNSIQNGAEANVQSDWDENNAASDAYIVNKPTLGTAAERDVALTGDAEAEQVVLGSDTRLTDARPASDVQSWAKASEKPTYTASEVGAISIAEKGVSNGVAELDEEGKIPTSQLPGYVSSILEYDSIEDFPVEGESGIIYIAKDTNKTYRWSGSMYVSIDDPIVLGETSSTAYRGDRGKIAYDHSQTVSGNPHNVTKADVGLGDVDNTSDLDKPISTATQTALDDKVDKVTGKGLSTEDFTTEEKEKLTNIESGANANVQSDWDEDDSSSDAFIVNKPTFGSAAFKDVPESGNASDSQVVLGDDSRLYDERVALDVPLWAKEPTKPSYSASEVGAIDVSAIGAPDGVAGLDENGKIDISQLPEGYSGSVYEYNSLSNFPAEGVANTLYIAKDTEKLYRWAGATYIPVSDITITKSDIGLGNVDNTSDLNKPVSTATQNALDDKVDKVSGKGLSTEDYTTADKSKLQNIESGAQANVQSDWEEADDSSDAYIANKPSLGTAAERDVPSSGNAGLVQVVLGNDTRLTDARSASDVYLWAKAPTKPTYTASEVGAISASLKGVENGIAELDENGRVPSYQLPGFVDNILEYSSLDAFPEEGESGILYIAKDNNKTYRWGGTEYVEISASLALGETSSTAYRGDRGKVAFDHAAEGARLRTAQPSGFYKIATTDEGHIASVAAVQKSDITDLGIPSSDTTYEVVSKEAAGLAPKLPNENTTTKYLRQDGSWEVPPDTTYSVVTKSNDGLVPQLPDEVATTKYLRQDGTWAVPVTVDSSLSTTSTNPVQNKTIREALPFNLGVESDAYGYYKSNGDFVAFKSQADIDGAEAAARVGTAKEPQVLSGYTFTNSSSSGLSGSMTNKGSTGYTLTPANTSTDIAAGYYNGSGKITVSSGVDSGKAAINSGAVLSGYQGWVNGAKVSGNISSKAADIYYVSSTNRTISSGQYLSGTQSIKGVTTSGISASNIKYNTTVKVGDDASATRLVNVTGTFTKSGTQSSGQSVATSYQILTKYSAWVNGAEVKGSISNNGSNQSATEVAANMVRFPAGYYTYQQIGSEYLNPYVSLTNAQAKYVLSHTETATPTGSDRNNSAYNLGAYHNYRYVNTAVCYAAGYSAGNTASGAAQNLITIPTGPGTSSKREFYFNNNLYVGNAYAFVIMAYQTGSSTYSGVGSGAATTVSGGTLNAGGGWAQFEVKSSNTGSNFGGMMMISTGRFTATASSATLYANIITTAGDAWLCYAAGVFK